VIVVVDNYDSFTYNLVQYVGELGADPRVYRNDAVPVETVGEGRPRAIIVSPGPCRPEDAGISIEVIRHYTGKVPILGVCLGHQSIGAALGGRIGRTFPLHGKSSYVRHDASHLFEGIPNPFRAGRYHSLIVEEEGLPEEIQVTARTDDGLIMGLRHREHETYGVQFHPESILTPEGKILLENFLVHCGEIQR
jgi:anthranilate synthase/aminodeoxychorismate synthase-like glutamine amidotransferase